MTTNILVNKLVEKEQKLAHQLFNKKKDIQLLVSTGTQSSAIIDDTMLDQFNLIIGFISKDGMVCNGTYADRHFSLPIGQEPHPTRVWLDCRDTNNIKYYVNNNGNFRELSEDIDEENNGILIVLLENPDFVQLSLYDSRLPLKRESHIFTSAELVKPKIRTVAFSLLNQYFPGLAEHLKDVVGDGNGEE